MSKSVTEASSFVTSTPKFEYTYGFTAKTSNSENQIAIQAAGDVSTVRNIPSQVSIVGILPDYGQLPGIAKKHIKYLPKQVKTVGIGERVGLNVIRALPKHICEVGFTITNPMTAIQALSKHVKQVNFHAKVDKYSIQALSKHVKKVGLGASATPEMARALPSSVTFVELYAGVSPAVVRALPPHIKGIAFTTGVDKEVAIAVPHSLKHVAVYANEDLSSDLWSKPTVKTKCELLLEQIYKTGLGKNDKQMNLFVNQKTHFIEENKENETTLDALALELENTLKSLQSKQLKLVIKSYDHFAKKPIHKTKAAKAVKIAEALGNTPIEERSRIMTTDQPNAVQIELARPRHGKNKHSFFKANTIVKGKAAHAYTNIMKKIKNEPDAIKGPGF